jgi:hypothetical protein
VIVDNRGAPVARSARLSRRAAPDGYTLLVGAVPRSDHALQKLPYSFGRFAPIPNPHVPNIVVVNPSVKARTSRS